MKKNSKGPFSKILWAIDPIGGDKKVLKKSAAEVAALTKGTRCQIEPVCVFTPPHPYIEHQGFLELLKDNKSDVQKLLKSALSGIKLKGLKPPKLLSEYSFSTRGAVKKITDYAKRSKADLIVVSSHARSGLSRLFMGSFAETLVLQSKTPVFIVSTHSKRVTSFKNILFPSDFSAQSKKAYDRVLLLARATGAKVTIYHKVELLTEYATLSMRGAPLYQQYLKDDVARRVKIGGLFKAKAEKLGVAVELVIDEGQGYLEDSILKVIKKKKPSLVALASESGTIASALLGSVTRIILRKGNCPVWALHVPVPKNRRSKKKVDPDAIRKDIGSSYSSLSVANL